MTLLPSLLTAASTPKGHLWTTQSGPPRSLSVTSGKGPRNKRITAVTQTTSMKDGEPRSKGYGASDYFYNAYTSEVWSETRTRHTWLSQNERKLVGEVRNIQVLGVLGGRLVVAFQGQGSVHTFAESGNSLPLEELIDEDDGLNSSRSARTASSSGRGGRRAKYDKFLDSRSRQYRYVEYKVPLLPTSITVVGVTELMPSHTTRHGVQKRPPHEAKVKAHITACGQVDRKQSFLSVAESM